MAKKLKSKYKVSIKNQVFQSSTSDEFNPDYSDVIKDLKRIGILAVIFFSILVGLSFFLG